MDKETARKQIEKLRSELHRHNHLYYSENAPVISDLEFDRLLRELSDLEKLHPYFDDLTSPTHRIGGAPLKEFNNVKHLRPMMSLDNTYDENELREFDQRVHKLLPGQNVTYVLEPKVDGVSISLHYKYGNLILGATRGDGVTGDDITSNIKTIRSIPLKLSGKHIPEFIEVRGEAFLPIDGFQQMNEQREKAGEPLFANPRNAASGSLKQLDPKMAAARPLAAVFYAIGEITGTRPDTHAGEMKLLKSLGLPVPAFWWACKDIEEVIEHSKDLQKKESTLAYMIDGCVIKVNEIDTWESLGATAKSPRYAIAFKYSHEQAETVLHGITIQVGRTGILTPVAELEPVQLAGSTISRATLHNEDEIKRKDIRIGDTVVIEKAGQVIPAVVAVNLQKRDSKAVPFDLFRHIDGKCPVCDGPIVRDPEYVAWRCENLSCPAQLKRTLQHYAGKSAMDIEGLGEALVHQLVDSGLVKTAVDLYRLSAEQVMSLERMGPKSAENVIRAIEESKHRPLWRLLHGLGIPHVGEGAARKLADHFKSIRALSSADSAMLLNVEDIGEIMAEEIVHFFQNIRNKQLIEQLTETGLTVEDHHTGATADTNHPLFGKTVVVTGTLSNYTRDGIKETLRSLGAIVTDSVSKKTNFLIAGEDAGSKLEKARKFNVPVLSEVEFEQLLK